MLGCGGLINANETEDLLLINSSPSLAPMLNQITSIYTSNPISLRSTLVLPFHLRSGLPNNFFLSDLSYFHVQQAMIWTSVMLFLLIFLFQSFLDIGLYKQFQIQNFNSDFSSFSATVHNDVVAVEAGGCIERIQMEWRAAGTMAIW
jgi:hypothetical protein